jgi:excinuclease UvrABC nuclease subunit
LERRFNHKEWRLPNLIVLDGGIAQINVTKKTFERSFLEEERSDGKGKSSQKFLDKISIVSVLKDEKHKARAILGDEAIIKKYKKEILLANNEAHRFAITFHKKRRNKDFIS